MSVAYIILIIILICSVTLIADTYINLKHKETMKELEDLKQIRRASNSRRIENKKYERNIK
jgi:predicted Holliday junction resolvase-like endonuclease